MWRIGFVFSFFVGFFLLILIRLLYWQIIVGDPLRLQATAQYNKQFVIPATRGDILSHDGSPLAMNTQAFLAYAEPQLIQDPTMFAKKVSDILLLDKKEVLDQITNTKQVWVPLKHKIDKTTASLIRELKFQGLGLEKESKRYYPEASSSAHLLGFVGLDENGNDKGYFGLEGYYDRELKGKNGTVKIEKDVRGAPIVIGDAKRIEAEDGRSLVLWIDKTIQRITEKRLLEGISKYGAKEGSVVVMDPHTGGILSMASFPSYDQSDYTHFDKLLYKNPIVASTYEPGSTFKVLTMAAGLNEHVITPLATIEETGPITIGEYSVRTWNNQYLGTQTMTEVLQHSSNVGMVYVAQKLGKDKLLQYIKDYGFGKPTGVDLEEESSSELRPANQWSEIDLATLSFGQGIAVTPLQMVRAVSVIANGGWLVEPHMVRQIVDAQKKHSDIKEKMIRRVLQKETANVITEMMINAVDNGEAKWAKPKGYRIAGKTGTAQIPVAGHYDEQKTIASFVGFAPADNPRFVMLVTLREPSSSPWGSETAAPMFFSIARDIFVYLGIPPQ